MIGSKGSPQSKKIGCYDYQDSLLKDDNLNYDLVKNNKTRYFLACALKKWSKLQGFEVLKSKCRIFDDSWRLTKGFGKLQSIDETRLGEMFLRWLQLISSEVSALQIENIKLENVSSRNPELSDQLYKFESSMYCD